MDPDQPADNQPTNIAINLEAMVKSTLAEIDRLEEEYKTQKQMLQDVFENDTTYKAHAQAAKEATRVKSNTKSQILKQPQVAELNEKVKSLKSQLVENQESLSEYLREYNRLTGITEIEGNDGELHQIVYVAKLVKKS